MSKRNVLFRKRLFFLPALLFLIALLFIDATPSPGMAQDLPVRVLVNGREVYFPDARPFVDEKGRVQVPARFVARELGAQVTWDGEAATAHISGPGKSITLAAGRDTASVNGEVVALDSGAFLIEDRIYVPMRFIAETLGATVQWDEGARAVRISMDQPIIRNFGISHTKNDAGWHIVPRTFTTWVAAGNTKRVDFYLTPTGTGQEPVKIATSYGSGEHFSITYRLPRDNTMAHFWAVAVNDKGETSTDILNIYREAAPEPPASIDGVPLHPSFDWGEELDATTRENLRPWLGTDYDKGAVKVILSTWLLAPSSNEIKTWYEKNLADMGWRVLSLAGGGSHWVLTAEKEGRSVTIHYAWGSGDNGTEMPSHPEKGYRMAVVISNKDTIFTPVSNSALSIEQKTFIEKVRKTKGVHQEGDLYVIALGEQPNPGYGLEIEKTEMSWEQATVYVKLTKPEPDKMYAAVISYPYLAGKVTLPKYTTIRFVNVETGEFFHLHQSFP